MIFIMKLVFSKQDFQKVKESEQFKKKRLLTMNRIDRNMKEPDFNRRQLLQIMKEPDFSKKMLLPDMKEPDFNRKMSSVNMKEPDFNKNKKIKPLKLKMNH